jgi:hypothetical protein
MKKISCRTAQAITGYFWLRTIGVKNPEFDLTFLSVDYFNQDNAVSSDSGMPVAQSARDLGQLFFFERLAIFDHQKVIAQGMKLGEVH